jgi:hypothetical protein
MKRGEVGWGLLLAALTLASTGTAEAQDKPPYLMAQPIEYTDVPDAFEADRALDIAVGLDFVRARQTSTISREHAAGSDRIGGRYVPIAQAERVSNALALQLGVGVYRDLMVYARVPLVLSDTRQLRAPTQVARAKVDAALGADAQRNDPALFGLDFNSATRSGVPDLEFGVAWGIVNQYRTPYLPTWVVSAETRIGIGKLLEACAPGTGCNAGISRGTARVDIESRWSYRYRYVEPYLGLRYALEFATAARKRFAPRGDNVDDGDTTPPSVAEATLGAALIAWEERGRFQRFAIDVRGRAAYVSAGRDYSPLFDALGTSPSPQLNAAYVTSAGPVRFDGLTEVDAHAQLGLETALAMQAARYVRFRFGVALWHQSSHLLTDASPCAGGSDGSCSVGHASALYRPVIDATGQRFWIEGDVSVNLFANATGQF